MSIAIFAAGCFWGIEKKFDLTKGVTKVEVGYTGGETKNPTYEQVCYEETGHAEVVRVNFDENIITYKELLNVFWSCHNPITLNRQGPDIGKQYRSAIFYLDNKQKLEAEESKKIMNKSMFDNNIVTEITKFNEFYLAEEYHQKYLKKLGKY
jgi:peptide-methionine (S)-S-oxide reductase